MTDHVDILAEAEAISLPWLNGFWREEHNALSPIPEQYTAGVRDRAKRHLDVLAKYRWLVIEEWDQWMFEAEALP